MALTKVTSGLISADASSVDLNIDAGTLYIDATNNRVGIGTTSPTGVLTSYKSTNGDPVLGHFYNDNAGTATEATVYVTNSSTTGDGLFLQTTGTAFTTIGGFVQDSAVLGSGTGASGGLSIMTRANADMRFYTNGHTNERLRIDSSGNVGIGTSSPTSSYGFSRTLEIYHATNAEIAVSQGSSNWSMGVTLGMNYNQTTAGNGYDWQIGGSSKLKIDSSGNVGIGVTPSYRFHVKGAGNTSSSTALYVQSSDSEMFVVRNDGRITTGATTLSPYNNTTASAANMYVDSSGILYRSTSSLRYKTNVQDATHGLNEVLNLRSVTFEDINNSNKVFGGLIAEELHDAGLTEFVEYNEEGQPDAVAYGNMVSICIKAIQEQQTLIEQLQAEVALLKGE